VLAHDAEGAALRDAVFALRGGDVRIKVALSGVWRILKRLGMNRVAAAQRYKLTPDGGSATRSGVVEADARLFTKAQGGSQPGPHWAAFGHIWTKAGQSQRITRDVFRQLLVGSASRPGSIQQFNPDKGLNVSSRGLIDHSQTGFG
jgi:hypothetical protein